MTTIYIEWKFPKIGEKACFLDIIRKENKQILNREAKRIYGEIQSKKIYNFFKEKIKSSKSQFFVYVSFVTFQGDKLVQSEKFEVPCNSTSDKKTRIYLLPLLEHVFYFDYYNWDNIIPNKTKLRFNHYKDDEFLLEFVTDDGNELNTTKTEEIKKEEKGSLLQDQIYETETPVELIDSIVHNQNIKTKDALRRRIVNLDPYIFEDLIGIYFEKMGYQDVKVTSKSRDGGIDAVAKAVFSFTDIKIIIQVKRYKTNKVDAKTVRAIRGALPEHRATQGIIVTTSDFTSGAKELSTKIQPHIILISGNKLIDQFIDKQIGVKTDKYGLISIDVDFFKKLID